MKGNYLKIIFAFGDTIFSKLLSFLAIHVLIVAIVNCLLEGPSKFYFYKNCIACYLLPVIARFLEVSPYYLEIIQNSSSVLIIFSLIQYFYYRLPNVFSQIKIYYAQLIWQAEHGILSFVANTLQKVFVPTYFLLFWIIAFGMKYYEHNKFYKKPHTDWYLNLLIVISNVCTSPISLIATSVTITYISYAILFAVKVYLHGLSTKKIVRPTQFSNSSASNETTNLLHAQQSTNQSQTITNNQNSNLERQERQNTIYNQSHTGWEEGLTTLLLSMLTGITELKQPARMAVLTIILFAVLSSLLQSMCEIAEPVVLSLSTHGKSLIHHIKIIFFCGFLFTFPLYITWVLSQIFPVDFWITIVLSTSVLTSAQVLDLFIIHCLLWFDSTREEASYGLDDLIYIIRGFVKIIEFIIAVSVVLAGIYEATFNRFSWISIMILVVHAYVNVIQRLISGFGSFRKRRNAVCKTNKLPNATKEQLQKLNDVCSICFINLSNENTSVVTNCNHYFHRVCLRRWLQIGKDSCPMCNS